jgi:hypothetical protein
MSCRIGSVDEGRAVKDYLSKTIFGELLAMLLERYG